MKNKLVFIETNADAEAVFLNGHLIACYENDGSGEPVSYIATEIEKALGVQCVDFLVNHPGDDESWSWDQLYDSLVA